VEDALEVRIAHPDLVHVVERLADVVDARTARADSLRHQPRATMQVELADVRGVAGVGDESKRAHDAPAAQPHRNQPGRVDAAEHLAAPEAGKRAAHALRIEPVGHAPARAAAAKAHHQSGLAARAAVSRGKDAQRPVVAVRPAERLARIAEARRPHQRAIAEDPELAFRQLRAELHEIHSGATI
jgi:hypothetical protein